MFCRIYPVFSREIHCLSSFASSAANGQSSATAADSFFHNRNPRNLEKLRIAFKPKGFHLDKPGKSYWNKLVLKYNRSSRSVTGEVVHISGLVAASAATSEWALCKHLYRLVLKYNRSSRSVTGEVVHISGLVAASAATSEWALCKHLYSRNDVSAHVNLARVLAQRCIEVGISEVSCFIERKPNTKVDAFLTELEKEGITLSEPEQYEHPKPSDPFRPEKPWEVY